MVYLLSENKLEFLHRISTESPVWDFGFEPETERLVVLTSGGSFLRRFEISLDALSEVDDQRSKASEVELERFFEGKVSSVRTKLKASVSSRLNQLD